MGIVSLEETREVAHSISTLWGHNMLAVCSPGEGSHQNLTMLASWYQISSIQNCKKENAVVYKLPSLWHLLRTKHNWDFRWFSGKESACLCRRCGFDLWVGKIPWKRKW